MRNLKKILALVLALVMSMSLVVTANAFSDDDAIAETYREAATVLDGLKVLQGRDDGNFDPKANITRAEMAAIIYRIVTTDVEDKQTDIYAESSKLYDLDGAKWAAGYVGFCNNSQLIMGYPDGTFQPLKNVTGHEALAMLLRAMGYGKNGEFVGKDWAINTAIYAKTNGLLANINESTLSQPATREMVAEMAFRALLAENVDWSLGLNYQPNGKTLAQGFGLERIEGVVTANEYADLYGTSPKAEGKTVLDERTLNITTELTDIGESRYAWVVGKDVLYMADTGLNNVYENEGAAVANADKAANAVDVDITDDTEKYVNFGGDGDVFESDVRIQYMVEFSATATKTAAQVKADFVANYGDVDELEDLDDSSTATKFVKVIRAEKTITALDLAVIRGIFAAADDANKIEGINGDVFVGTNTETDEDDISNSMSYKKFYNEYITAINDYAPVTSAGNGEWLKVIDNNGDGDAEYAFLTQFVMTTITDIDTRKDEYHVEYEGTAANRAVDGIIPEVAVSTEIEELAEGDVILYAKIDGVYHISYPQVAVETINKKGIDYKDEIITCGETPYEWSDIFQEAYYLYHDISEATTEVSYDLYLDHFGYVRLFTESAWNRGFALLTDGWFDTDKRDEHYKAEIWNAETEKFEDVNVLDSTDAKYTAENFIDDDTFNGDKDWGRLLEFEQVYADNMDREYVTNIAAFSTSDDGYTLTRVQNASNKADYKAVEIATTDADGLISVKDRKLAGLNAADETVEVRATTDTLYYFVVKTAAGLEITSWVGYNNAPATALLGKGAVAYAVTTTGIRNEYDVAEIVVFETNPAVSTTVNFAYALGQKLIGENYVDIYALGYDAENGYGPVVREGKLTDLARGRSATPRYYPDEIADLIKFYNIDSNGVVELIDDDYNGSHIYAGNVTTSERVDHRDWIGVTAAGEEFEFFTGSVPSYVVTYNYLAADDEDSFLVDGYTYTREGNVRKTFGVEESKEFSAVGAGDEVIFATDAKGNITYIINVTESVYKNAAGEYVPVPQLGGDKDEPNTLYKDIIADQNAPKAKPVVEFFGVYDGEKDVNDNLIDQGHTDGDKKISVTYAQALANKTNVLSVSNAKTVILKKAGTVITAADIKVENATTSYDLTIVGNDDEIYTYTLEQVGATSSNNGTNLYVYNDLDNAVTDGATFGGTKMSLNDVMNKWYTHNGVECDWLFYDAFNESITNMNAETDAVSWALATVTSSTGTHKTWTILFEADAELTNFPQNVYDDMGRMMKGNGLTYDKIAYELDDLFAGSDDHNEKIVTALKKLGASVQDVFTAWDENSWSADKTLVPHMLAAGYSAKEIALGYADFWADQTAGSQTGLNAQAELSGSNGNYTLKLGVGESVTATHAFDVITAAGYDTANTKFTWTVKDATGNTDTASDKTVVDWTAQWSDMASLVANGTFTVKVTITTEHTNTEVADLVINLNLEKLTA